MLGDTYEVLPLPVKIGDEIRKQNPHFKPFIAVYFPDELLHEMKWSKETRLKIVIEKDVLGSYFVGQYGGIKEQEGKINELNNQIQDLKKEKKDFEDKINSLESNLVIMNNQMNTTQRVKQK